MNTAPDEVLESARVREVTGIFHSRAALEAAAEELLLSGFDRADIDRLSTLDEVREKLGNVYVAPQELADIGRTPRRPFFTSDDISVAVVVTASLFASAGALAAILVVFLSGGGSTLALVAAGIAGAIAGGIGTLLVARVLAEERRRGLDAVDDARGVILWVRVRSPYHEFRAQQVLREHGAEAVRVHEIPIEKRPEDIPLSSLRPDPWLGEERLGQP